VVDDYPHECPALGADTSLYRAGVAWELTSLVGTRHRPHERSEGGTTSRGECRCRTVLWSG
jgi:hypothetical protein